MRHKLNQVAWECELDELEALTKRSPLEVGFNHGTETLKELKERLTNISQYIEHIRNLYSVDT